MEHYTYIMGSLGFVGLWIAYHVIWCGSLRTLLRQQLFRLRDQFFLEAARGVISFDDPEYGILRTMMQRTLAAAEHYNVIQVAMVVLFSKRFMNNAAASQSKSLEQLIAAMPDREKAAVYEKYHRSTKLLIATHMVRTMPVPIIGTVLVFVLCRLPGVLARSVFDKMQAGRSKAATNYIDTAYQFPEEICFA